MLSAKILVVEDERIIAQDLKVRLQRLGYQVTGVASSGEEAVREAESGQPDLILMDLALKGDMDGVEAARIIQERRKVPVIYVTAYTTDARLQQERVAKPYGYILKPFQELELQTAIEHMLQSRATPVAGGAGESGRTTAA